MFTIKVGLNQSKTLIAGTDYVADIKDTDAKVVEIDFLTPLTGTENQKITVSSNDAAMYIFDLNAYTLTGGYTYANKVKFGTTTVGNAGLIDVAAVQKAAAVSSLTTAISNAQSAHDGAIEGVVVGNKVVGAQAVYQTAINVAQTVLTNAATSTTQQITDAQAALATATTAFNAATVAALPAFTAVTVTADATGATPSAVVTETVTLATGETITLTSSDVAVATATEVTAAGVSTITVASTAGSAAADTATITVEVKNAAGNVIKTGTIAVTLN